MVWPWRSTRSLQWWLVKHSGWSNVLGLFQLEESLSSTERKRLYISNLNSFVWRHDCNRFLLKFWLKQCFSCLTPNWNSPQHSRNWTVDHLGTGVQQVTEVNQLPMDNDDQSSKKTGFLGLPLAGPGLGVAVGLGGMDGYVCLLVVILSSWLELL